MNALGPPDPAELESRYEALRKAALGEPMAPECRSGLALFLRRGLWGWGRAVTSLAAPAPELSRSFPETSGTGQYTTVVRLFAALAIVHKDRKVS